MKRFFTILLVLTLALCTVSFAGSALTRYNGICGFTLDYPEDLFETDAYGTTTTLFSKDSSAPMSISILAEASTGDEPVSLLVNYLKGYKDDAAENDIRMMKTNAGSDIYVCTLPSEDSLSEAWVLQEDGRQFFFLTYLDSSVRDACADQVTAVILSFATDPNGDMSGYEQALDEDYTEPDFYTTMTDIYSPALTLWGTAAWEQWAPDKLQENGVSPLLALMNYDANQIHFDFVDLDNSGDYEMVLYTVPTDGSNGVDLLAIVVEDDIGAVIADTVSAERDLYSLCGDLDNGYVLREDASNSAYQSGIFFFRMEEEGQWKLADGLLCTANESGDPVWYRTDDTTWETEGHDPITEAEAMQLADSYIPCTELDAGVYLGDFMRWDMGLEYPEAE